MKVEHWQLKQRQSQPLEIKIRMSEARIRQYYDHFNGDVYIAGSGGKDSDVLRDIVRKIFPDVPTVFVNTGLQYPEVRRHALSFDNVIELRPKKKFCDVVNQFGWPVVSKRVARYVSDLQNASERNRATCNLRLTGMNRKGEYCPSMKLAKKWLFLVDAPFKISNYCCDIMKKSPFKKYSRLTGRKPLIGTMASDSSDRMKSYLRTGCNSFIGPGTRSCPLSFWTEQDILRYIVEHDLQIAAVYGKIVERNGQLACTGEHNTGCTFCAFGANQETEPNRFQRMRETHPKLYKWCGGIGLWDVLDYVGVPYT